MNTTWEKINKAQQLREAAFKLNQEAAHILSGGPESYYHKQLGIYIAYLFNEALPFKENDRVVLSEDIDAQGGWYSSRHFLIKGEQGIVRGVDIDEKGPYCDIEFDNETWIDDKGKKREVTQKHTYGIRASKLINLSRGKS